MQDRYVGDVGDFGKFALLRDLTRDRKLRLGVVWCHYPDEGHNGDGRHVSYLQKPSMASLDPELHSALNILVANGRRSLHAIEQSGVLPLDTLFFRETLRPAYPEARSQLRLQHRASWLDRALSTTAEADLVFFDPDNGLETPSIGNSHPKAGKYIFWEELVPFWQRGQSLVVYHHLNRTMSASEQTGRLYRDFSRRLANPALVLPMTFRRGSCRHFWVVAQQRHAKALKKAATTFLARGWAPHFDPL